MSLKRAAVSQTQMNKEKALEFPLVSDKASGKDYVRLKRFFFSFVGNSSKVTPIDP